VPSPVLPHCNLSYLCAVFRGEGLPFGTASQAMLSSFDYMLGNFNLQFEGSVAPTLSLCLVIVFVIFMIVLMFNLLIALMGNTFAYVSSKGLAQWRREQASIMVDEQFMRDANLTVPSCLFVLMYTTDFEAYDEARRKQDAAGSEQHGGPAMLNSVVPLTALSGTPDLMHDKGSTSSTTGLAVTSVGAEAVAHPKHYDGEGVGAELEKRVLERVDRLEQKLDSLLSKLDTIAGKKK
jgi:hypothetical protein